MKEGSVVGLNIQFFEGLLEIKRMVFVQLLRKEDQFLLEEEQQRADKQVKACQKDHGFEKDFLHDQEFLRTFRKYTQGGIFPISFLQRIVFQILISCQQSTETRLAGILLLTPVMIYHCIFSLK